MAITLSADAIDLDLPADLYWNDEHAWHPVEQVAERTLTGAIIVQSAAKVAGRPITLQPEDDGSAWMSLATLNQLRAWAAVPGKKLVLTLRGQNYDVIFRHHDGAAVEARPVVHYSDAQTDDFYNAVIRLMEI